MLSADLGTIRGDNSVGQPSGPKRLAMSQRAALRALIRRLITRQNRGGTLPPTQVAQILEWNLLEFRREFPAERVPAEALAGWEICGLRDRVPCFAYL
jgi:hypothetical protein